MTNGKTRGVRNRIEVQMESLKRRGL